MCALFCAALHAKDPEMQKRLKDNGNQDKERKRERSKKNWTSKFFYFPGPFSYIYFPAFGR